MTYSNPKHFDAILVLNISLVCGMWSMMKNFASSDQILVYSYYIFEMREKGEMDVPKLKNDTMRSRFKKRILQSFPFILVTQ